MDPELLKQLAAAGMTEEQLRILAPQLQLGQQWMQPQTAQGRNVGPYNVYTAASPVEHLSNALRQIVGAKMMANVQANQKDLLSKQQQARQAYMQALQTDQQGGTGGTLGPSTGPLGEQGGGMARPPGGLDAQGAIANQFSSDPAVSQDAFTRLAQERMRREGLALPGMASGDLSMAEAAKAYLGDSLGPKDLESAAKSAAELQLQRRTHGPSAALGGLTPQEYQLRNRIIINPQTGQPMSLYGGGQRSQPPQQPADPNALEPIPPAGKLADNYRHLSEKFEKDMDAASASSRSAYGQSANIVFRSARILPLLQGQNPDGTPRQLTTQEWQDVSAALVAMQTNGVPPERMTLNATPKDLKGDAASIMSWLTSKPYAPDRQEWIDRFVYNINREEEAAKGYQREVQMQRLGQNSQFLSQWPNRAKQAARSYGIEPELIDQVRNGTYRPPPPRGGGGGGGGGGAPGGTVQVREKSSGRVKALSADVAAQVLSDPSYERVQ
jgi:hypothetical protein